MLRLISTTLYLLVLSTVLVLESFGQDVVITQEMSDELMNKSNIKGPLEFRGFVKELSKKLKGAYVTLYESSDGSAENVTEIFKTTTQGSGMFEFKLEINKFYILSVEKEGYTTKKVDFDTDVTLAREQNTSVPKFEFEVDMVKDLDGLAFVGAVAHVFYQIKQNKFDYQLDYSKEEMEDEERELREQKEKQRLAELAYEKKKEIEEAAKLLLDQENATAQQIIEATITVGGDDKVKIVKGFMEMFPEVDTLREKKAAAMYDQLLAERKKTSATGSKIDFQSIFDSAKAVEIEVETKAEEARNAQVAVLRKEQEELQRKSAEAMAMEQKALEVEAKERLAAAIAEEELKKAKEEKEKRDQVYYAIFESNGDSETAIQNLIKTYPKSDPYREQKAKAIYSEYEKTRLTGTTLSNMDFNKLFEAANFAEQEAIKEDIAKDNEKQNVRLEVFKAKEEEQKRAEQERTVAKIEGGLKEAPKDRASQIEVFKNALPKNDLYKEAKAEAMYEQYNKQKEALNTIERTINLVPKDKKTQYELFFNALSDDTENRAETAQKMYDSYVASVVFQKAATPAKQLEEEKVIMESLPADLPGKEQIAKAMYNAGVSGSGRSYKAKQLRAIADNLPANLKNREEVAEQIFDQYVQKKQAQGGTGTVSMDFASLFGAADAAQISAQDEVKKQNAIEKRKEQEAIEAKREEVREQKREMATEAEKQVKHVHREELAKAKNNKERSLAEAIETGAGDRDESVRAISKALPTTGDKELDLTRAEAVYDAYLKESREIEKSSQIGKKVNFDVLFAAADQAELKRLEKEFQQKEAEREQELAQYEERRAQKAIEITQAQQKKAEQEIVEAEKDYEEALLKTEAIRQERLAVQQKEQEELEKSIAMEKARRAAEEKERAAEELAKVEQERKERLAEQRKEEDRLAAIEAEKARKAREEAEREAAEQWAQLEKQKKEAEEAEEKRRAAEAKEAERLALAKQKEQDAERKEKERKLEEERKAQEAAELAAAKAAEDARKAEEKRLEDERKAQEAAELAAAKAAEDARKAEEKRIEDERKAQEAAELAAAKAAEDARKAEEKRLEEERKAKEAAELAAAKAAEEAKIAEQKRKEELAKQEAEAAEQARRSQYDKLISEGDAALAKNDVRTSWQKYKDALTMYPEDKEASKKFNDSDDRLEQLEKAEAEQLALDQEYQKLMTEGEDELAQNNYDAARERFQRASDLKPSEKAPKDKILEIGRTLDELAAERKAKQMAERKYMLKLQDAANALEGNDLILARSLYEEANRMKPEEQVPVAKLKEISDKEEQLAKAEADKKLREQEAKEKYAAEAAAEEARREQERVERDKLLKEVAQAKLDAAASEQEREEIRKQQFEVWKEEMETTDLSADERRRQFLSKLAQLYPQGVTKETVNGKNFVLLRHVINENNVVTIYEKKTWDWGGVFYFKNSDIAITEALYKLEIGKY
jgi:hypothetical protein